MSRRAAIYGGGLACILLLALWIASALKTEEPRSNRMSADSGSAEATATEANGEAVGTEVRDGGPSARGHAAAEDVPQSLTVRGRVIDPERFPVRGAQVRVLRDSHVLASTRAGETGSFEVGINEEGLLQLDLVVADPESASARARHLTFPVDGRTEIDLGDVLLTPAREVRILVTGGGRPVAGARVVVAVVYPPTRMAVASSTTDADGRLTVACVPVQALTVFALGEGFGRGETLAERNVESVTVALPPERSLQIEVVDAEGRGPLEDIQVAVDEIAGGEVVNCQTPYTLMQTPPRTDALGMTVLRGLAPDMALQLRVIDSPGYSPIAARGVVTVAVPPRAEMAVLALGAPRDVRWPVVESADGTPPREGTRVRFESRESECALPDGRIRGGELLVRGLPRGGATLLAVAESGELARVIVPAKGNSGTPVAFYAARTVRISITDDGGQPVAGIGVSATLSGSTDPIRGMVLTDERGIAVLSGLYPQPYQDPDAGYIEAVIHCFPFPPSRDCMRTIARVDLGLVEQTLEVAIPREEIITLEFIVKGKPQLPTNVFVVGGSVRSEPISESPATGEICYRVRRVVPDESVRLNVFTSWGKVEGVAVSNNRATVRLPP